MIRWQVRQLAEKRGWNNANQLAREAGLSSPVAYRVFEGDLVRVDFDTLNRLCAALECRPGDLLVYEPDKGAKKQR